MDRLEWLSKLVAMDTTSRNSNLPLIEVAKKWFDQHGLTTRITYAADNNKANLFATLPTKTGETVGGMILSGHTDVVPVDGQQWKTNPFSAAQVDDKIVGRGTCDMKGFLAVMLALVPDFKKMALPKPIHFALSYDEEVGCLGAPLLIADFRKAGFHPSLCIVGEPTGMQPVVAHKGIQVYHCRVQGVASHSSLTTQGCNAIEYAAKAIHYIHTLAQQFESEGPYDEGFDVPFSTLSTNMIHGGIAQNIIPDHCEFFFEFRQLPCVKPESVIEKIQSYIQTDLLPAMQKKKNTVAIEVKVIAAVPSFEAMESSTLPKIKELLSAPVTSKVAYATEAGLFQQADIPTIVCGPGNIEQAHKANEFVLLSQLEKCEMFLRQMVEGLR